MLWIAVAVVFSLAVILTGYLRQYALKKSIIDIPNERSSHTVPTPRGGGVAIVVAFLLSLLVLSGTLQGWWYLVALLGGGALCAVVGFLDDHGHIAARWRLIAHFACAAWVLAWMPQLPPLLWAGHEIDLGIAGYVLAAFYLVWMLNLYNFMDGIDGIASVQAITTCLLGGALLWQIGALEIATLSFLLAAAVGGFLVWNFPPARIFMGDAGSGFLGLVIGAIGLFAAVAQPALLWAWSILMGVFIVDATFTLFRRLLRGDKVYEAHRSHAYQYASREVGGHRPVTLAVLAINLLWLGPWAFAAALGYMDPALCLLFAYLPLLALALRFHAGKRETA